MGYDISYHPINEQEIQEWYFDCLTDDVKTDLLADEYGIQDFYREKFKDVIRTARQTNEENAFDKTHGLYVAIVQGFLRKYYYTRGSAFSFLVEEYPDFAGYTKKWEDILGYKPGQIVYNQITENYSSGVYIPFEQVVQLLADYENDESVRQRIDERFSHKRVNVFLKALQEAKENGWGLLEASEVVEPDPLDLNNSGSFSNLFNCDTEGPLLYEEACREQLGQAMEQIRQAREAGKLKEAKEKKGFWKKLFGKKEKNPPTGYPKEVMSNTRWAFYGGKYASQEDFVRAVTQYQTDMKTEWDPEQIVLPYKEVTILYEYRDEDEEDQTEEDFNLTADKDFFTAGELLFKIHNQVVEKLENDDHHFFEGLILLSDDDNTGIPCYMLSQGS